MSYHYFFIILQNFYTTVELVAMMPVACDTSDLTGAWPVFALGFLLLFCIVGALSPVGAWPLSPLGHLQCLF